jgi:cardiolipin synthase (CMP-forming)
MNIWTIPNLLTVLRLFTIPLFAYLVLNREIGWAFLVLFIASFSDWLDGLLARKLNQYSVLGEKLDPIVDRLYIITLVIVGLIIEAIAPIFVLLILLRESYLALLMIRVKKLGYLGLPVHVVGKMGAFCLMGGLPLSLIATEYDLSNQIVASTATAFVVWGVGLYLWSAVLYTKQYSSLRKHDQEN